MKKDSWLRRFFTPADPGETSPGMTLGGGLLGLAAFLVGVFIYQSANGVLQPILAVTTAATLAVSTTLIGLGVLYETLLAREDDDSAVPPVSDDVAAPSAILRPPSSDFTRASSPALASDGKDGPLSRPPPAPGA